MTDDIVTRLHNAAKSIQRYGEDGACGDDELLDFAATEILRLREQAGRAVDSNALTEQREKGLRANIDEIANHAYQISRIVSRGSLRPEPALVDAPAASNVMRGTGDTWEEAVSNAVASVKPVPRMLAAAPSPPSVKKDEVAVAVAAENLSYLDLREISEFLEHCIDASLGDMPTQRAAERLRAKVDALAADAHRVADGR